MGITRARKNEKDMKAAIVNPYLDSLGGGERYTMAVAEAFAAGGYKVDVQWKSPDIKQKLEKRFGINLADIEIKEDVKKGDGYDVLFWVSDGSIPLLQSRNNLLHFQMPFKGVGGKSVINKMKFFRIRKSICNSNFTKLFIDREYGIDSAVVYPPVDVKNIKPKRKENIILAVGRFSQLTQAKRQDVLIDAFIKLYKKGIRDWRLILAGGVDVGVDSLSDLKEKAKNYPIIFYESPSFSEIKALFGKAKIFWTASGFGVDVEENPSKVEHFGISVIEAMAAEAVPFAFNAGGHKETIDHLQSGFLWNSVDELVKQTEKIILDRKQLDMLSKQASEKAHKYSYDRFKKEILAII